MISISTDERGIKVWRDDKFGFPKYSVSISKKNEDGTYTNAYQTVAFRKGVTLENGEEIIIDKAFPTFDSGKDGRKYVKWMITEFKQMNKAETKKPDDKFVEIPNDVDEELPF